MMNRHSYIVSAGLVVLMLAAGGCSATGRASVAPAPFPTDGNAGSVYAWCVGEAERQSPAAAWTIRGRAYVDEFVRVCMLKAGAQPVVIVNR